jgi:hypothetical protein
VKFFCGSKPISWKGLAANQLRQGVKIGVTFGRVIGGPFFAIRSQFGTRVASGFGETKPIPEGVRGILRFEANLA